MDPSRTRRFAVAVCAVLLVGCGGGAGGDGAGGDGGGGGGEEQTAGDAAAQAGPLAEFFGYDEQNAEDFAEQERRIQELVVACMAREGFEYLPVDYPEPAEDPVFAAQENLSPEEYAKQYGYGITTIDYAEQEVEFTDPNQELVEAMQPAEQEAYYLALYGEQPEFDPEDPEAEVVEYGFGGGCQGEASEEVYGGDAEAEQELGPRYEELYERIEADPRLVEANRAWSACMAEAGHEFARQEETFEHISNRHNELYEEAYEEMEPGAAEEAPADGEVPAGATEETETEFAEPQLDEGRLAELREEEIAIAVADQACAAEHLPPELRQEVSSEYEQAFVEENRELLERARDAQQGG